MSDVSKHIPESEWLDVDLDQLRANPLLLTSLYNEYREVRNPVRSILKKLGVKIHDNAFIKDTDLSRGELVLEGILQNMKDKDGNRTNYRKVTDELFRMIYGGTQRLIRLYHEYKAYGKIIKKAERIILDQNGKWVDARFMSDKDANAVINAFIDEYDEYSMDSLMELDFSKQCEAVAKKYAGVMDGTSHERLANQLKQTCSAHDASPVLVCEKYSAYLRQQAHRDTDVQYIVTFVNFVRKNMWMADYPLDAKIHLSDLKEHIEVHSFFEEVVDAVTGGANRKMLAATVKEAVKGIEAKKKRRKK